MYESFYRLSANPFRLTPDPRFCFSHPAYQESRAYLDYAVELGEGFILLTGRPGAGKTTLVQSFIQSLVNEQVIAARIAVTDYEANDLLRAVAYTFGIDAQALDKATVLRRIEQFFTARVEAGQRVLLVIDEAQRLSSASLEELRLLADLQFGVHPLLQVFLVGQEALRQVMREPEMEQLQQRVIGTCRLGPLGARETRAYIEHRLRQADWQGDPELTGDAVLAIYEYSAGVPRHINKICTRLLLQAYLEQKHRLDADDVERVARELGEEQLAPLASDASGAQTALDGRLPPHGETFAVSELAVRMEAGSEAMGKPLRETPLETRPESATRIRVPAHAENRAARPAAEANGPVVTASTDGGRPQAPHGRRLAYPGVPSGARAQASGWRIGNGAGAGRFSPRVVATRIEERPVALFGVVAAVTLIVGGVTASLENRVQADPPVAESGAPDRGSLLVMRPLDPTPDAVVRQPNTLALVSRSRRLEEGRSASQGEGLDAIAVETAARYGTPVAAGQAPSPADALRVATAHDSLNVHKSSETAGAPSASPDIDTEGGLAESAALAALSTSSPVAERAAGADTAVSVNPTVPAPSVELGPMIEQASPAPEIPTISVDATQVAELPPESPEPAIEAGVPVDSPASVARVQVAAEVRLAPQPAVADVPSPERRVEEPLRPDDARATALLAEAEQALAEDRLLIPAGNSAYDYYQRALALEPANPDARQGLARIVMRYTELARLAIGRGDLPRANKYIDRGLRVQPGDKYLTAMREGLKIVSVPAVEPLEQLQELPPPVIDPETPVKPGFLQRLKTLFGDAAPASKAPDPLARGAVTE